MASASSPAAASGEKILLQLQQVEQLREQRHVEPAHLQAVLAIKAYQAARFERCYADLLAHPRYAQAARFFLNDLYGPQEFAQRDAQFARVVPALVRLFPADLVATVAALSELHALTEQMDDATARGLPSLPVTAPGYLAAWQHAGQPSKRERQIRLTLDIGQSLDRYTRKRLMRATLHMMRGPAQAAGLGALQRFLESGFDAFADMKGADAFLQLVGERERALVSALFHPDSQAKLKSAGNGDSTPAEDPWQPLEWLP